MSQTLLSHEETDITNELENVKDKLRQHQQDSLKEEEDVEMSALLDTPRRLEERPTPSPRKSRPSSRDGN